MRVRWLNAALRNLDIEAEYIARDNPEAAAGVVIAIQAAVERLSNFPSIGRPGRVPGTRELVVSGTPYIIPYRVRDGEVQILRVFHGARKWPRRFGAEE
jgi:toxin ParE1/3/4